MKQVSRELHRLGGTHDVNKLNEAASRMIEVTCGYQWIWRLGYYVTVQRLSKYRMAVLP